LHRFPRIDRAWICNSQLNGIRCEQAAIPGLDVLKFYVEIFYHQFSDGRGHPTVLIAMIVHGTALADLPADGDEFVEIGFVDEVAGVVLAVPG
jgi:hypothetical protein